MLESDWQLYILYLFGNSYEVAAVVTRNSECFKIILS